MTQEPRKKRRNIDQILKAMSNVGPEISELAKFSVTVCEWFGEGVVFRVREFKETLYFMLFSLAPELRGTGLADEIIAELQLYSDYTRKPIIGTPTQRNYGDVVPIDSLKRFYERVGFRKTTADEYAKYMQEYIYLPKVE